MNNINLEISQDELYVLKNLLNNNPCVETMEILKQIEEKEYLNNKENLNG